MAHLDLSRISGVIFQDLLAQPFLCHTRLLMFCFEKNDSKVSNYNWKPSKPDRGRVWKVNNETVTVSHCIHDHSQLEKQALLLKKKNFISVLWKWLQKHKTIHQWTHLLLKTYIKPRFGNYKVNRLLSLQSVGLILILHHVFHLSCMSWRKHH